MKRFLLLLVYILALLYTPTTGHAGPKEDYEQAYKIYIAAGASVAAYNDRIGESASRYLEQDGWRIAYYTQEEGQAGARFLVAKKENADGKDIYVVALVGTENADDVKLDLKVEKVYFAGNRSEDFISNAAKREVPETEPKIHRGFDEYVKAGPTAKLRNEVDSSDIVLSDLLKSNTNFTLYLTGHSLGGAAATIAAARLISMGVKPEQIEVITFGAPAVGNAAFAAKFEPIINLTRVVISGDPVTGVLQTLAGGYKQFGREITWKMPATVDNPHKLIGYVDVAIKNYYDKRQQALQAGVELHQPTVARQSNQGSVYIAPVQNHLPSNLQSEFRYMREALGDEYRQTIPNSVIAGESEPGFWLANASAAGYRWLLVPDSSGMIVKQERNTYYITFSQTLYDVTNGAIVSTAAFSTGTYNLTPLEAFIHTFKGVNAHQAALFGR